MPKKKVTEAVEEVVQEPVVSEPVPPQAPRRQGSDDLLELNDLERGVTREDSEDAKWGYLAGAARRQQILTGIVSSGIIQTENGLPVCPVDFEGLRILIPIREMVLTEWPEDDPIPRSVRIQIGRMLGATIDFIPAAVDIRNRAAIGTKGELLNSDMIARIIPKEDGGCIILTKDGQHFHSEIDLHDEVNDYNSIRSIIPCQGVSAVYLDDDGDSEICPCAFVMLMSDGKIEPFVFATDKDIERIANKGHTGFTGFVPTK